MKKRNYLPIISIALIILSLTTLVYAIVIKSSAWHASDNFILKIDGTDRTLSYAITNNLLRGHVYASPSLVSDLGHNALDIWLSVNGVERSLLTSLSLTNGLCGSSVTSNYLSAPISQSSYHLANQIEVDATHSFQDLIDLGTFCCIPSICSSGNCGSVSDGCGGTLNCGTCSRGTCVSGSCVCTTARQSCSSTTNCCASLECRGGRCCLPSNGRCMSTGDCCTGVCSSGRCQ